MLRQMINKILGLVWCETVDSHPELQLKIETTKGNGRYHVGSFLPVNHVACI